MTPDFYKTAFDEATTRITELANQDHQSVIPHIPDWTAGNVIIHVGLVFSFVNQSIRQGAPIAQHGVAGWANDPANHPDTSDLSHWFQSVADSLGDAIWSHHPDDQVWTSSHHLHTAKFWMRRMTQEAVMHRWDIEAAHGDSQPIDAEMAVDGINEFYDFFVAERLPKDFSGNGTVHLHAIDAEGEWMITRITDGITVEKTHGKGDVAARGPASDLLLFVWNRKPPTGLETFGNIELLEEHQRLLQI